MHAVRHAAGDRGAISAARCRRAGWTSCAQLMSTLLATRCDAMPGRARRAARDTALGLPYRVASNSSHAEMAAKFARIGLGRPRRRPRPQRAATWRARQASARPVPRRRRRRGRAARRLPGRGGQRARRPGRRGRRHGLPRPCPARRRRRAARGRRRAVPRSDRPAGPVRARRCGSRHDHRVLATLYPWTKSFHVISMVAWMAGMFYLPRLFVYHCECSAARPRASASRSWSAGCSSRS